MVELQQQLDSLRESFRYIAPEGVLIAGLVAALIFSLITSLKRFVPFAALATLVTAVVLVVIGLEDAAPVRVFYHMLQVDDYTGYFKFLGDLGGILTVILSLRYAQRQLFRAEYYILILSAVLGAHLLVMSTNLVMVFISLELLSISSYVLVGFSATRQGAEGSLKYFLFGAVASAVMLYGFTLLYGISGTLEFGLNTSFHSRLIASPGRVLVTIAGVLSLTGFLFKIAGAPMHVWAPDVYEASPMPVVAFLSTVPKLEGVAGLARFLVNLPGLEWQLLLSIVVFLSLAVGNFSALLQNKPKRMMAYSSIAQSGFLLVGLVCFSPQGMTTLLFYATVYLLMNFLVFLYLQYFEEHEIDSIPKFAGVGKNFLWPSLFCLVGLVALTGLPPTAGFTAKLLIFSSLLDVYTEVDNPYLLILLVFGLLNTVVSLFFYLKIPYYAFLKTGESPQKQNILVFENLLGLVLVLLLLVLFFRPGLLMGWINTFNFAP